VAFGFGLRVLASAGSVETLPDTDANRGVLPSPSQEELSRSPFPPARWVLRLAWGPQVIFDATLTAVQQGERGSVLRLLERHLEPGMLLWCAAGIGCSAVVCTARRQGAHVLARLERCSYTRPWVRLHAGSSLVKIPGAGGQRLTAGVLE
jgi:hypothetical protein